MPPTRVIYDGLPKGSHTWIFEEGPGVEAVCPDHDVVQALRASLDGSPRPELLKVCPRAGADGACGQRLTSRPCSTVIGRPDVFPNDVLEVADLNDPKSHRAYIARDHIARGIARVLNDGDIAPAAAPAP